MKEILKEILASIKSHKIRFLLTGFGIAWGMFILIVLLGAGNGFRTGVLNLFQGYASNSIWLSGQRVSVASIGGLQVGSKVKFDEPITIKLKNRFPQIKQISSEIKLENISQITYKDNMGNFEIKGVDRDYNIIKLLEIETGRFLNDLDYKEHRATVVIGSRVKELLFKNENPLGKQINISGVYFQVVGVLKEGTMLSIMEQNNIYTPNTSLCRIFNLDNTFFTLGALLNEKTSIESFENELRNFLAKEIGFDKSDRNALYINNIQLQVKAFNSLFDGIDIFLWILGLCFLLSGIIGIANIMFVVVKERTTEIGIRKALGATPESIITLVLAEALITTLIFGIIGLMLGYIGMGGYNWIISIMQTGQQEVFAKAVIQWNIVLLALFVLIIAGILAGVFPAQKAAKIMPVQTLNKVI